MAAVSSVGITFNTNDGTKQVVAIPPAGELIVIVTAHCFNVSDAAPTDDNADGQGTYTEVESLAWAANQHKIKVFIRDALVGSATSTTFTHAPGTTSGGGLCVLAVSDMTKVGAAAKVRSGSAQKGATDTPEVPWDDAGTPAGTNPIIGAVTNGTNPATLDKPANFDTELHDVGHGSPAFGFEIVKDDIGCTDSPVTWGSATASTSAAVILELDASAAADVSYTIVNGSDQQLVNVNAAGDDVDAYSRKVVMLSETELATLLDGASFGQRNIAVLPDLTGIASPEQRLDSVAGAAEYLSA